MSGKARMMIRRLAPIIAAATLVFARDALAASPLDLGSQRAFGRLWVLAEIPPDADPRGGAVYGDDRGSLHILERVDEGTYRQRWQSTDLGAAIKGVFVEDVDADGAYDVLAYHAKGDIFLFSYGSLRLVWQTDQGEFDSIGCLTIANLDHDPQLEMIFAADSRIFVYDGLRQVEEYRSEIEYSPKELVVGDVDADGELEIVLNTGFVLDARFLNQEWEWPEGFGDHLELLDIDDDGVPELLGEYGGGFLKIFDIDIHKEKWEIQR